MKNHSQQLQQLNFVLRSIPEKWGAFNFNIFGGQGVIIKW